MFYIGIVEENIDPLKLGRLRIRVLGIHTENKAQVGTPNQLLLTEELPWAIPAYPISNSNIDGISDFSGIEKGTKVFVFFLDRFKQKPVYFGVMPFILDEQPDYEQGFSDPDGEHPNDEYKDESSISRLARNEKIADKTYVKTRKDNKTTFTVNEVEIEEPEPGYAAQYPYNRVIETKSGIIIELDSTKDAERIHIYHPKNTFTEIYPDGSKVTKTKGNNFDITLQDKFIDVEGNLSMKVKGAASIEINGAADITCNDVVTATFKKDASITAEKKLTIDGSDEIIIQTADTINVGGNEVNISSSGAMNIESTGKMSITSSSIIEIDSNGALNIDCNTCTLSSTGVVDITGSLINLN